MADQTIHALITYRRSAGQLLKLEQFSDSSAAIDAYEAAEKEHYGDDDLEIVLLGSDSIESMKITHGHYFRDPDEPLFPDLDALLAGVATA